MNRAPRHYPELANTCSHGFVRARHAELRAIVQFGPDPRQALVIDVPEDLSHNLMIGCPILLDFDEQGILSHWRVGSALFAAA